LFGAAEFGLAPQEPGEQPIATTESENNPGAPPGTRPRRAVFARARAGHCCARAHRVSRSAVAQRRGAAARHNRGQVGPPAISRRGRMPIRRPSRDSRRQSNVPIAHAQEGGKPRGCRPGPEGTHRGVIQGSFFIAHAPGVLAQTEVATRLANAFFRALLCHAAPLERWRGGHVRGGPLLSGLHVLSSPPGVASRCPRPGGGRAGADAGAEAEAEQPLRRGMSSHTPCTRACSALTPVAVAGDAPTAEHSRVAVRPHHDRG